MRARSLLFGWFFAAALLASTRPGAAADPSPSGEVVSDPWTTEARRHFKNGVKLYQEANYAAALAEFETAYQKKPGPGSLQNVALCQKALLRYVEAADTLKVLLERHANELSEDEKTAARLAHDELEAYIGSIVVRVRPSHAKVTLDGRALDVASLGVSLRTNVGDHTLVAEAPGFARATKSLRVAVGARDVPVELALVAVMGFLQVRASDPEAVVAIDGRPVAMGSFSGPVSPGEDHLVQVYRSGYEPFEARVAVEVGETKAVSGVLGERVAKTGAPPDAGALPPPPPAKPELGWYSIAGLNLLGTAAEPLDFDSSVDGASSGALSLNLRLGRRVKPALGVEVLLDAGTLNVERACDQGQEPPPGEPHAFDCGTPGQIDRNYQLGWFRFGPLLRLSTPGEHWRFGAGFGAGLVWHQLRVARHEGLGVDGGKARGTDPFFLLEVGGAYHIGHLSIGLDLSAAIDGAGSLDGTFDGESRKAFEEGGNVIPMLGIGLRAGYSQWSTEKKHP